MVVNKQVTDCKKCNDRGDDGYELICIGFIYVGWSCLTTAMLMVHDFFCCVLKEKEVRVKKKQDPSFLKLLRGL